MAFEAGLWGGQQLMPTLWQQLRAGFFESCFSGFLRNTGTSGEWMPWTSSLAWAEAGEEMVLPTSGASGEVWSIWSPSFMQEIWQVTLSSGHTNPAFAVEWSPLPTDLSSLLSRPSFHQCHKGRINHVSGKSQDKSWPGFAKILRGNAWHRTGIAISVDIALSPPGASGPGQAPRGLWYGRACGFPICPLPLLSRSPKFML